MNDELPNQDRGTIIGSNNAYKIDGTIHVVYDDKLWRRTGQTQNPRVIALADGVSWEGHILTVHTEDGLVLLQHRHAGIEQRLVPHERTEWCYVTYERAEPFTIGYPEKERKVSDRDVGTVFTEPWEVADGD